MPIQLPSNFVDTLPVALPLTLAVALVGLACSLTRLIVHSRPVTQTDGDLNPRKASRVITTTAKLASMAFWLGLSGLHVMAWQLSLQSAPGYHLDGLSFCSTFIAVTLGWRWWRTTQAARWGMASPVVMPLLQVIGLACCSSSYSSPVRTEISQAPPGTLVVCETAHTDRGTPIHLYDRQVDASEIEKFYQATQSQVLGLARQAMIRSEPAPQINCHGWVFSGQHIIKGEDVPTILNENGYRLVDEPKLNDVVIYSDASGAVVHTGLVCGFLGEQTALIESKWGITGTYVHLVEEQPYSLQFQFYRSERPGHKLRYGEGKSENLAEDVKIERRSSTATGASSSRSHLRDCFGSRI